MDLEQFTMQATTLDEVETYLGPPLRTEGLKNGSLIVDYALDDAWNRGGTVFLFFDSAHVLVGKAYVEDEVEEERT